MSSRRPSSRPLLTGTFALFLVILAGRLKAGDPAPPAPDGTSPAAPATHRS